VIRRDFDNQLQLDRCAQGQLVRAERQAGMATGLTEDCDQQVRGTVDHGGLLGEALGGCHVATETDDAFDRI
jgi:hypothetical protein